MNQRTWPSAHGLGTSAEQRHDRDQVSLSRLALVTMLARECNIPASRIRLPPPLVLIVEAVGDLYCSTAHHGYSTLSIRIQIGPANLISVHPHVA